MKYPVREIDRSEEIFLEIIAEKLEEDISNYEVQVLEEVFDEDSNRVFWVFEFDRGTKIHTLVISPDNTIQAISPRFPQQLLLEITNSLIDNLNFSHRRTLEDCLNNSVE
tara:strand:- start:149 stop:478 length:330 start_codon:yes stop_codon:yes gene_type:complete